MINQGYVIKYNNKIVGGGMLVQVRYKNSKISCLQKSRWQAKIGKNKLKETQPQQAVNRETTHCYAIVRIPIHIVLFTALCKCDTSTKAGRHCSKMNEVDTDWKTTKF